MTQSINSSTAVLPQQPAATQPAPDATCGAPPPVHPPSATGVAPDGALTTTGGGAVDAVQGAAQAAPPELVAVLQQLVAALEQLLPHLQQLAAGGQLPGAAPVTGGGPAATGCGCGMPGCTHGAGMSPGQGSMGAPTADAAAGAEQAARGDRPGAAGAPPAGVVDPSTVRDRAGTEGLAAAPLRGLHEAHRFGLPLVSGHRPGGPDSSDHTHGNAIDVSTLPIGAASSTEGTPQMKAYAEHMRQAGRRGELGVKYVILDGQIASPQDDWAWRPYTYPGKSAGELAALKQSNRGEYNRIQHHDHVHVSFR